MFDIEMLLGRMEIGMMPTLLIPVSIVVGLLALLFGYRLFKLFVFLAGFAIGTLVFSLFTDGLLAILGGVVVGAICCVLWVVGAFAQGALLGGVLAAAIGVREQIVVLFMALLFGVLAVAIQKFMIVISTSWFGSNLITSALTGLLLGECDGVTQMAIVVVITGVGIVCQYTVTSGRKKEEAAAREGENQSNQEIPQSEEPHGNDNVTI